MNCMVIIIGLVGTRSKPLEQSDLDSTAVNAVLLGGCPNCGGGGLVAFDSASPAGTIAAPPGTSEMYVVSFGAADPAVALANAHAWIASERAWLNTAGKVIRTFTC